LGAATGARRANSRLRRCADAPQGALVAGGLADELARTRRPLRVRAALKPDSQPPTPEGDTDMFPTTNTETAQQTETKAKKPGTTYDLVDVIETVDEKTGEVKKTFRNIGTIFIRASGENGVVYVKQGKDKDGKPQKDREYAVFKRRNWRQGGKQAA
jgi:hypothetical protein